MASTLKNDSFSDCSGTVKRIIARNEDSGWAVIELDTDRGAITLTGGLAFVDEGLRVQAEGEWVRHPTFGDQFKVSSARMFAPVGSAAIERFLKSGAVRGIGPVFAKKIVERFGEKTLEVIEHEQWRLKYLKGVGPKRIDAVAAGMAEYRGRMEVLSFLHGQLGPVRAQRVYDKYGNEARDKLAENPYRLIDEMEGIGFTLADRVARDVGIKLEDPARLQAGVVAVLKGAAAQGHTCAPQHKVRDRLGGLLGSEALADRALAEKERAREWRSVEEGGEAYLELHRYRKADERVATLLVELAAGKANLPDIDVGNAVDWAAKEIGIEFEEGQAEAIRGALEEKVCVITGGPGVGKTTILNGLLKILEAKRISVALAAPTGRAASRMAESTGREAETIHRLLEYHPQAGGFQRKADSPIAAEVIIVDEASMMDLALAKALLEATPKPAKLILVGDADQLPSVGPGNVLEDLIESGLVRVCKLTKPYRQAASSPIIANAHLINHGIVPDLSEETAEFEFVHTEDKQETAEVLIDTVCRQLPGEGIDPFSDMMCLVPVNKGVAGVEQLNNALQERLNPHAAAQLERVGRRYRVGDKVIQTKNNRDLGVFNGEVGLIRRIDMTEKLVMVRFDQREVRYSFGDLSSLALAYCLTVHRAQGSEYPCVVVAVDVSSSIMLTRKLLYTAVTRAKRRVILIGQKKAMHVAVSEARAYRRHTLLASRIRGLRERTQDSVTD